MGLGRGFRLTFSVGRGWLAAIRATKKYKTLHPLPRPIYRPVTKAAQTRRGHR